jgi:hypothetical protein
MTKFAKILTGAAGLAMVAGAAAPAAAQYAPYGGYNQGYNGSGGVVGAVIGQILGGGRYGAYGQGNDRVAVDQCARAAEARVTYTNRANASRNYGQGYADPRYGGQAYGYNQASMARVVGITQVERRSNGLKVAGVIDSGMSHHAYGNQGYGYGNPYGNQYPNQGYNQGYYGNQQGYAHQSQVADLRFSCRVDFRGQVTSLDIKRNVAARRGY